MNERRGRQRIRLTVTAALTVALIVALPLVATTRTDQTWVETVALGPARAARVEIALDAGHLRVAGGSLAGTGRPIPRGDLVWSEFTAGADAAPPAISYDVVGDIGHLTIDQTYGHGFAWPWEHHDARWDVALNPTVPTDLHIELGTGECDVHLGGLTLTDLAVSLGAGEATFDFTGDWRDDLAATIESGAGELTILVPRDLGVRIDIEQGAGSIEAGDFTETAHGYVNEAHGQTPVTLDLEIEQGAGEIQLKLV